MDPRSSDHTKSGTSSYGKASRQLSRTGTAEDDDAEYITDVVVDGLSPSANVIDPRNEGREHSQPAFEVFLPKWLRHPRRRRQPFFLYPPYLKAAAQLPSLETMQGPTGWDGVQRVPKRGHSEGVMRAVRISPHRHPLGDAVSVM